MRRSSTSQSTSRPPSSASLRPPSSASAPSLRSSSSTSSLRPHSSASIRPSSSASLRSPTVTNPHPSGARPRPPSSASLRPSSSASIRPSSSVSLRPSSSASIRTFARRAPSRASATAGATAKAIKAHAGTLAVQVTGLTPDDPDVKDVEERIIAHLEYAPKAGVSKGMDAVEKSVSGHAMKARIYAYDELGDAFDLVWKRLKGNVEQRKKDEAAGALSNDVRLSYISEHVYFLTLLSAPPVPSTLTYASTVMAPPLPPSPPLTWADLVADSDNQDDGLDDGDSASLSDGTERLSPWSSPSFTSSESELEPMPPPPAPARTRASSAASVTDTNLYAHRAALESLRERQYWRSDWTSDVRTRRAFDIGDASTLGPSMRRALGRKKLLALDAPEREWYINEQDAVREILFALQGRANLLLDANAGFKYAKGAPRLVHLTLDAQESMLCAFGRTAATLADIRKFISSVISNACSPASFQSHISRRGSTRTVEALADALAAELRVLDTWCAAREEALCRARMGAGPTLVVSLLRVDKELRDAFAGAFEVLRDVLRDVELLELQPELDTGTRARVSRDPLPRSARILDALLGSIQAQASMGEQTVADAVTRVFVRAAEPTWAMLARWLDEGMPLPFSSVDGRLDADFFIEDIGLELGDSDFWSEGYAVREAHQVPTFLDLVSDLILRAGKATGLLRALGFIPPSSGPLDNFGLLFLEGSADMFASVDDLARAVYESLQTRCEVVCARLTDVLVDECALWRHLSAVEDLYLMRRGDALSHFADVLFAKMDSGQSWGDFHFLNTAFGDVVGHRTSTSTSSPGWIDSSLVRFSYRTNSRSIARTVRALDGLSLEYIVPFPLTYIFGPRALETYGRVFVFLLQIRRAKSVLERILVRRRGKDGGEMKAVYAMRGRMSWFINMLMNFIATYVIQSQLKFFHAALRKAKSLDDMTGLHDEHLDRIEGRCLLKPNTSALYRAILSILDLCLVFGSSLASESSTLDLSQVSAGSTRRHRSRRLRRQGRNVIGFSQTFQALNDDSSDDDSDERNEDLSLPIETSCSSNSFREDGIYDNLEKMSTELDGLVRFIRRGVESVAGGTSDAAGAYGVLAFALEDWDA